MTYFSEIDWTSQTGGLIVGITPGSVGAASDLKVGDQLLAVNGKKVDDIIDVRFYAAEEEIELLIRRDDELVIIETERDYDQELGIEFQHPTFDTDIRRCNNLCEFCFVLQMAPRFRRTLYIKDDDYRYSFLFGHYVTLTNLDDHDWWKIENMGLSPLYVSVHATDLETRRRFLRNELAPDIMGQLRRLADAGITIHTQLVIVPEFNDGELLQQSIGDLASLHPAINSISIVPVGLTSHHKYGMRKHTREEAKSILAMVDKYQVQFRNQIGSGFVYATDEWYLVSDSQIPGGNYYDDHQLQENGLGMVRDFLDEWRSVIKEIEDWIVNCERSQVKATLFQYQSIALVTGTLFEPTLIRVSNYLSDLIGLDLEVIAVENQRLGKTITVAGLLMAKDVIDTFEGLSHHDAIVLPRIMFDHPDTISLDNIGPQEIATMLDKPVALADQMGDVWDVIIGRSNATYFPKH
jgi:putative radical SAM enzyme (TIGR03279 family)